MRARSKKIDYDAEEQPSGWASVGDDEDKDSKCASIKRKLAVASDSVHGIQSIQKRKKNKKKKKEKQSGTADESAAVTSVTSKSSPPTRQGIPQTDSTFHQIQEHLHSSQKPLLIHSTRHKLSQPFQHSDGAAAPGAASNDCDDIVGSESSVHEDLGSGLRNFYNCKRQRTKTRSKAKNLKKDKRPPEFRPGGEK